MKNIGSVRTSVTNKVLKGINFGNSMEVPPNGWAGIHIEDVFFDIIEKIGFTCVRIPIRWSSYAKTKSPYDIDKSFFKQIDHLVKLALNHNLTTIINLHHYEEIMHEPEAHKERFLRLWEQISTHYKEFPSNLFFEILNEPMANFSNFLWNQFLAEAIDTNRTTNPNRILIVGPTNWNNLHQLENLKIPDNDPNILVTFHFYEPFQFTHQGAVWVEGSDDWLGTTWTGTEEQKKSIDDDFDIAFDWAKKNNVKLFLGEFGAYEKADLESRASWTSYVRSAAEKRGIHWCYWEFAAGFGIYDISENRFRLPLLKALLPYSSG